MDPNDRSPSFGRETLLTVVLTGLAAGGFLFFLILISGGFFFYVVLAVTAMVGLGLFHYVLWGHAMTQDQAQDKTQPTERPWDAPDEPWKESIQRKL